MAELNIVEKVIALESVELLQNLTPDQLARIASIAREVKFLKDKVIIEPNQPPEALYVILDGSVKISRNGDELYVAHQHEVLGSWALFDPEPLAITARTREDTRLLRISREDFYDLLADNSEITASIFSTLVKRFRQLVEK
ncbi:MAG: cyclic nucleotide-binding domain-containing protein [Acidobacteria bacterium]|nr:cyclic nucleotide-binding domain-containing protein [Acidobacteriota bacterium]MBI3281743.1 cyclic nucleotide-binding domain-containing protein [Acidobacteriota bacterium]